MKWRHIIYSGIVSVNRNFIQQSLVTIGSYERVIWFNMPNFVTNLIQEGYHPIYSMLRCAINLFKLMKRTLSYFIKKSINYKLFISISF